MLRVYGDSIFLLCVICAFCGYYFLCFDFYRLDVIATIPCSATVTDPRPTI
jgi:hypothetical protein